MTAFSGKSAGKFQRPIGREASVWLLRIEDKHIERDRIMATKKYTYEDALIASKDAKREVHTGYIYEREDVSIQGFAFAWCDADPYASNFRLERSVERALSPFFDNGELDVRKEKESMASYLARVHFDENVITTGDIVDGSIDRTVLQFMEKTSDIYEVITVDHDGREVSRYFLTSDRGTFKTPKEAIDAWDRGGDASPYEYARRSDHIYSSVHHSPGGEERYYSGFETMEEAREFADRFDLTLCLYNSDRGFSRGDGYNTYSFDGDIDPVWDDEKGIDLQNSFIGGAIYVEAGWSRKEFDEEVTRIFLEDADDEEEETQARASAEKIYDVFKTLKKGQVMLVGFVGNLCGEYEIYDSRFTLGFYWSGDSFSIAVC